MYSRLNHQKNKGDHMSDFARAFASGGTLSIYYSHGKEAKRNGEPRTPPYSTYSDLVSLAQVQAAWLQGWDDEEAPEIEEEDEAEWFWLDEWEEWEPDWLEEADED
jgi:hypothetical protein